MSDVLFSCKYDTILFISLNVALGISMSFTYIIASTKLCIPSIEFEEFFAQ